MPMMMRAVVSFMTTIIAVIPAQNAIWTLGPMTRIATTEIAMQRTFHTRQFLLVRDPEEERGSRRRRPDTDCAFACRSWSWGREGA
jgi:hypothetical protein